MEGFAAAYRDRFDTWVRRARTGLLDGAEIEYVADQVRRLADFPDPAGVPCHRDWQPRNWLTAEDGSVSMIDFGNARVGHWFQDFERMWWTEWRTNPQLGDAFFERYGHVLDDAAFGDHARSRLHQAMAGASDPI